MEWGDSPADKAGDVSRGRLSVKLVIPKCLEVGQRSSARKFSGHLGERGWGGDFLRMKPLDYTPVLLKPLD